MRAAVSASHTSSDSPMAPQATRLPLLSALFFDAPVTCLRKWRAEKVERQAEKPARRWLQPWHVPHYKDRLLSPLHLFSHHHTSDNNRPHPIHPTKTQQTCWQSPQQQHSSPHQWSWPCLYRMLPTSSHINLSQSDLPATTSDPSTSISPHLIRRLLVLRHKSQCHIDPSLPMPCAR